MNPIECKEKTLTDINLFKPTEINKIKYRKNDIRILLRNINSHIHKINQFKPNGCKSIK